MSARAALAAVLLGAAAFAWILRMALIEAHRAPAGERLPSGSTTLIDDPDGNYHLRRVALALELGAVPQTDGFLNFPRPAAVPWPTFFDAGLATAASIAIDAEPEPGELLDEARLEAFAARVPPLLGALAAALVGLLAFALARGRPLPRRLLGGGVAGAVYASTPIAVWYGGVARVDHHVATALFLAGMLVCGLWAQRSPDRGGAVLWAVLAGALAACSLLTWLASALTVAVLGAVLGVGALAADPRRAAAARTGGLALFATAALVCTPPALGSPWNELQPGSLINLSNGVPRALLAACLPFAALIAGARLGVQRFVAAGAALGALAVTVALLPGFLDGAREGFAWASRQNQFMDVVDESRPLLAAPLGWSGAWRDLGWAALAAPLCAALAVLGARRDPARLATLGCFALLLWLTLVQRRFGNSLAVPLAAVIGLGVAEFEAGGRLRVAVRGLRYLLVLGVFGSVAVAAAGQLRRDPSALRDLAEWRFQRISGLQWMRANTPSAGPYNAPELVPEYGVLSTWSFGHGIEYHARRPSIATNFGSFVGHENFIASAQALLSADPDEFRSRAEQLGVRYVVAAPRRASELASLSRIAGWDDERRGQLFARSASGAKGYSQRAVQCALWQLALHELEVGERGFADLRLVWRAPRRETPQGRRVEPGQPGPSGPVLSIWEL